MDVQHAGSDTENNLYDFVMARLQMWRTNRETLTEKWERNRLAAEASEELDEYGVWKRDEKKPANDKTSWKSNTVFDITKQKIAAADAIIEDTYFRGGKVAFGLFPIGCDDDVMEALGPAVDLDAEVKKAEDRISRQLTACAAIGELGKCILSGATYGEYYAKAFVHTHETTTFVPVAGAPGVVREIQVVEDMPGVEFVPVWSIFRDLEVDDLHKGSGFIYADFASPHELLSDIGKPYHFEEPLKRAAEAGKAPSGSGQSGKTGSDAPPKDRKIPQRIRNIERYEFWGLAAKSAVLAWERQAAADGLEIDVPEDDAEDMPGAEVEVFVKVAGQEIVAYHRSEAEQRPVRRGVWRLSLDEPCGVGVADDLEQIQKVLTGAIRSFENNKKLTTNLILAVKRYLIENDIDLNKLDEGLILELREDGITKTAGDAVHQVTFEDVGEALLSVITLFMRFADLASAIPLTEQGQAGEGQQTAFEMQQRLERSGKYLGRVIKNIDAFVQQWIEWFYEDNLRNPDVMDGQVPCEVKALGFSSFENRVMRLQRIVQFLDMVLANPALQTEVKLRWLLEEYVKGNDLDPAQALKSPEEKEAEAARMAEAQAQEQAAAGAGGGVDPEAEAEAARLAAEEREVGLEQKRADAEYKRGKLRMEQDAADVSRLKSVADMVNEVDGPARVVKE